MNIGVLLAALLLGGGKRDGYRLFAEVRDILTAAGVTDATKLSDASRQLRNLLGERESSDELLTMLLMLGLQGTTAATPAATTTMPAPTATTGIDPTWLILLLTLLRPGRVDCCW